MNFPIYALKNTIPCDSIAERDGLLADPRYKIAGLSASVYNVIYWLNPDLQTWSPQGNNSPIVTTSFSGKFLADGDVGSAYTQPIPVSGSGTLAYSISGSLPPGLQITSSGFITGTPTLAGTYGFSIVVTDVGGNVIEQSFSIRVLSYSTKIQSLFGKDIINWLKQDEFTGATVAGDSSSGASTPGAYSNVSLGQPGVGDLGTSCLYSFSPVSSLNLFSSAFASAFNTDELTCMTWFLPPSDFWTDGRSEIFFELTNAAVTSYLQMFHVSNNQVRISYPNGSNPITLANLGSYTSWTHMIFSASKTADRQDAYFNGVLIYQQTMNGQAWSGALTSAKFGNTGTPGAANALRGYAQHSLFLNRRITLWEARQAGKLTSSGAWMPLGPVIEPNSSTTDNGFKGEPNIIFDSNPQLLKGNSKVFKCWYSIGDNVNVVAVGYAESVDFINWTEHPSNPIISGKTRAGGVVQYNGLYYMTVMNPNGGNHTIDLLKSQDGVTSWTVAQANIVTADGVTDANLNNSHLMIVNGVWYVFYDYTSPAQTNYRIGVASASSPTGVFTKSPSNPIVTGPLANAARTASGPWVYYCPVNGKWYMWAQCCPTAVVPTDVYRFECPNASPLSGWVDSAGSTPVLPRHNPESGWWYQYGQSADITMCEVNGQVYALYSTLFTASYQTQIQATIARMTLDQLVMTNEGILLDYSPQMLINGSFETPGNPLLANVVNMGWADAVTDGAIARASSSGEYHPGSSRKIACKLTAGTNKTTAISQQVTQLVPRRVYRLTGWARGDGGSYGGRIRVQDSANADLVPFGATVSNASTTYQPFVVDFQAPYDGIVTLSLFCPNNATSVAYFDDLGLSSR